MFPLRQCLIATLLAVATAACGAKHQATPPPPDTTVPFDQALAAQIDAAVAEQFPNAAALGASVAVTRADGSVHTTVLGIANTEEDRAVSPGDQFRIGSITKTFMATIILQLVDEGVLTLDDTLDHWVPGFSLGDEITLRRLMNHTSGVFNYTDDERFLFLSSEDWTPQQIVQWSLDHGPVFEPGTGYSYSNTNYFLIGMTIEAATGKKLGDVLRERILAPLHMDDVWLEGGEKVPSSMGFLNKSVGPEFYISWAWAAGGMDAPAKRLCEWGRALYLDGKILPKARVAEMISDTTLPGGQKTGYGLAADLNRRGGHNVIGHTGSTMGFRCEMFFDLATGDCVVVETNDFFANPKVMSEAIWKLLPKAP